MSKKDGWYVDSLSPHHMSFCREWFASFRKFARKKQVIISGGQLVYALGQGRINVDVFSGGTWKRRYLEDALFVPELEENVFSVNAVTGKGISIEGTQEKWEFIQNRKTVAVAYYVEGKYKVLLEVEWPENDVKDEYEDDSVEQSSEKTEIQGNGKFEYFDYTRQRCSETHLHSCNLEREVATINVIKQLEIFSLEKVLNLEEKCINAQKKDIYGVTYEKRPQTANLQEEPYQPIECESQQYKGSDSSEIKDLEEPRKIGYNDNLIEKSENSPIIETSENATVESQLKMKNQDDFKRRRKKRKTMTNSVKSAAKTFFGEPEGVGARYDEEIVETDRAIMKSKNQITRTATGRIDLVGVSNNYNFNSSEAVGYPKKKYYELSPNSLLSPRNGCDFKTDVSEEDVADRKPLGLLKWLWRVRLKCNVQQKFVNNVEYKWEY